MNEAQKKAAEAWQQMVRLPSPLDKLTGINPMPPSIALDFVQDICGSRTEAERLLFEAAKAWLLNCLPEPKSGFENWRLSAEAIVRHTDADEVVDFDMLRSFRLMINRHIDTGNDLLYCEYWRVWGLKALRVFDILDGLAVDAYEGRLLENRKEDAT